MKKLTSIGRASMKINGTHLKFVGAGGLIVIALAVPSYNWSLQNQIKQAQSVSANVAQSAKSPDEDIFDKLERAQKSGDRVGEYECLRKIFSDAILLKGTVGGDPVLIARLFEFERNSDDPSISKEVDLSRVHIMLPGNNLTNVEKLVEDKWKLSDALEFAKAKELAYRQQYALALESYQKIDKSQKDARLLFLHAKCLISLGRNADSERLMKEAFARGDVKMRKLIGGTMRTQNWSTDPKTFDKP